MTISKTAPSERVMRVHAARVLRVYDLHKAGLGVTAIARALGWTRNEVNGVIQRAKASGLWWKMGGDGV